MKFSKVEASSEGIRKTKPHEWMMRFLFGSVISLIAGYCGEKFGPVVGGLLLAFPSIMPATLTLVKKHDGREEAVESAYGTVLASVAMIAFAAMVMFCVYRGVSTAASLFAASSVWVSVSLILWRLLG
jgi:hypothetical protein